VQELSVVLISGALGGLLNAYLQDGGFKLPGFQVLTDGQRIFRPGFLGNILVGLAAAVVMWGLYGAPSPPASVHWQWAGHVAASILAGVGGSRVLTDQIDKKLISSPPA
jgi:hypothetical protein